MNSIIFPALRSHFGSWIYYSSIIPIQYIADHVSFIDDVHQSKSLSEAIQRKLSKKRPEFIKNYLLNEDDRFFNSLVLAIYEGTPEWFPANVDQTNDIINLDELSKNCGNSIGFLRFSGKEKIITIDGQHRLAGIKAAILERQLDDCVSVLFIAHDPHIPEKRLKTRRLFTALNKHAQPVDLFEIITLDENDLTAIVTRKMVENHKWFSEDRIAIKTGSKLSDQSKSFTTIEYLYTMLNDLFCTVYKNNFPERINKLSKSNLESILRTGTRQNDDVINKFYKIAITFFTKLADSFTELKKYFEADEFDKYAPKIRKERGGCIIFRTVGLKLIVNLIINLPGTIDERLEIVSQLPRYFMDRPYNGTIWGQETGIIEKNEAAVRNLILHCLGVTLKGSKWKSALAGWRMLTNDPKKEFESLPSSLQDIEKHFADN